MRDLEPLNEAPFPSQGHVGQRYQAVVRVNEAAEADYRGLVPGAQLPDATVITLSLRTPTGEPGPVLGMRKQAGAWEFVTLDADGWIQPNDAELCRRCHTEAPSDSVFGLPRESASDGGR